MNRISVEIDKLVDEGRDWFLVKINGDEHCVPKSIAHIKNVWAWNRKQTIKVEQWFACHALKVSLQPTRRAPITCKEVTADNLIDLSENHTHQTSAFNHTYTLKRFGLFMECRSGKTKVAIDIATNHILNKTGDRVVWLCPLSVINTAKWQWSLFCQQHKIAIHFIGLETLSGCSHKRYQSIMTLFNDRTIVIIDESHLVKNERAVRSVRIQQLTKDCPVVGILSGTPITRNISDIFNQIKILDWKILGYKSKRQFDTHHLISHDHIPGLVLDTANEDFIAERISPFVFEFFPKKKPIRQNEKFYCEMSQKQKELYAEIKRSFVEKMYNATASSNLVYMMFTALRSVLAGAVSATVAEYFNLSNTELGETPKIELLRKVRADIDDSCIVWCNRRCELEQIKKAGIPNSFFCSGANTPQERHEIIEQFKSYQHATLVTMEQVARHGLDLSAVDTAIFYGQSFDHEARTQAMERIEGITSKENLCFIDFVYKRSLDERIQMSHARKEQIIASFHEQLKNASVAQVQQMVSAL